MIIVLGLGGEWEGAPMRPAHNDRMNAGRDAMTEGAGGGDGARVRDGAWGEEGSRQRHGWRSGPFPPLKAHKSKARTAAS